MIINWHHPMHNEIFACSENCQTIKIKRSGVVVQSGFKEVYIAVVSSLGDSGAGGGRGVRHWQGSLAVLSSKLHLPETVLFENWR